MRRYDDWKTDHPEVEEITYRCPECDDFAMNDEGHCFSCGYDEETEE